jgi:hypothetical protein
MLTVKSLFATTMLVFSSQVRASYCAIGKIEASECSGFIIESCSFIRVDAVRDDQGKLYAPKTCYNDVSQYDASKHRCWIHTKSTGSGALSWVINATTQPNFLHKNASGGYDDINAEYITFGCRPK